MKSRLLFCAAMITMLVGCVDINTTITLNNDLPVSIELKVESPFIKAPKKSQIVREELGSDGYVDLLNTGADDKKVMHYFFMQTPSEALLNRQSFNNFFEESNKEHEGSEMIIPTLSNKAMIFDMAVINAAIAKKEPEAKKNDKASKVLDNLSWNYQFISLDGSSVKELIYLDSQDQWVSCDTKVLKDDQIVYLVPLKELFTGKIKQLKVSLN